MMIDGQKAGASVCDGMIISTPTGSTGHSLSAGGPIVLPEAMVFVISFICPHTLSGRPMVVPDSSSISIEVQATAGTPMLSIDGQVGNLLKQGDVIRIARSAGKVDFIHLPDYDYFSVLRQKLHWRGSSIV